MAGPVLGWEMPEGALVRERRWELGCSRGASQSSSLQLGAVLPMGPSPHDGPSAEQRLSLKTKVPSVPQGQCPPHQLRGHQASLSSLLQCKTPLRPHPSPWRWLHPSCFREVLGGPGFPLPHIPMSQAPFLPEQSRAAAGGESITRLLPVFPPALSRGERWRGLCHGSTSPGLGQEPRAGLEMSWNALRSQAGGRDVREDVGSMGGSAAAAEANKEPRAGSQAPAAAARPERCRLSAAGSSSPPWHPHPAWGWGSPPFQPLHSTPSLRDAPACIPEHPHCLTVSLCPPALTSPP